MTGRYKEPGVVAVRKSRTPGRPAAPALSAVELYVAMRDFVDARQLKHITLPDIQAIVASKWPAPARHRNSLPAILLLLVRAKMLKRGEIRGVFHVIR